MATTYRPALLTGRQKSFPFKYIHFSPWHIWKWMLSSTFRYKRIGIFRNLPHVKPGRWGFFILGFEIGSRNPRDPIGVWLIKRGIWRW